MVTVNAMMQDTQGTVGERGNHGHADSMAHKLSAKKIKLSH